MAIHHHVCKQVGPIRRRPRRGPGHRQSRRGLRSCIAHADSCSEGQHHGEGTVEPGQNLLPLQAQRSFQTPVQSPCNGLEEESEREETRVNEHKSDDRTTPSDGRSGLQIQMLALKENMDSDSIIRDARRVLTGTSMNHMTELFGTTVCRTSTQAGSTVM